MRMEYVLCVYMCVCVCVCACLITVSNAVSLCFILDSVTFFVSHIINFC